MTVYAPAPADLRTLAWRFGLLLLLLLPLGAGAAERLVDSPAALTKALKAAQPGDVLVLEPGDYGPLSLSRQFGSQALTLRAADPDRPPHFTRLNLTEAQGLVLEDIAFVWKAGPEDADNTHVSTIKSSQDITLRRVLLQGDVARKGNADQRGRGMGYGLFVRWVDGLVIENSELRTWGRAMIISSSQNITLRGNDIHSIRSDGMNFAQVSRVLIEGNHIHDFDRAAGSGDHADMIQFWTNRTTEPSTDIRIRDNLFNSGGGFYTHTIFMRNEEVDTGRAGRKMFYRNIEITGNIIINAHLHGISLGESENLLIASNTLIRNRASGGDDGKDALWTPTIRVSPKSEGVVILRNVTPRLLGPDERPDWNVRDNLIIQDKEPAQPGYYDTVFAAAISGDPASLASFAYREGGPADGRRVGAPGLVAERIVERAGGGDGLAIMQVDRDSGFVNRFHFDAGQTRMGAAATALWDFGDGTTAKGLRVAHDFARPGQYRVTLRTGADPAETTSAQVTVPDPQLLHLAPGGGLMASGQPVEGVADRGVIRIGGKAAPSEVPGSLIRGLYGAPDFTLKLDLATTGTGNAAGEILRVHEAFILNMTPTGGLSLSLFTEGSRKPRVLQTPPGRRLNDGATHRIEIHVAKGLTEIRADGRVILGVRSGSPVPKVNRPLVLGGAFGKAGVPARITALDLSAGVESWAN